MRRCKRSTNRDGTGRLPLRRRSTECADGYRPLDMDLLRSQRGQQFADVYRVVASDSHLLEHQRISQRNHGRCDALQRGMYQYDDICVETQWHADCRVQ